MLCLSDDFLFCFLIFKVHKKSTVIKSIEAHEGIQFFIWVVL